MTKPFVKIVRAVEVINTLKGLISSQKKIEHSEKVKRLNIQAILLRCEHSN